MEKRRPHYPLARLKQLILQGAYRVTRTSIRTAAEDFGIANADDLAGQILLLRGSSFYKSMTTLHDATLWQDVYHGDCRGVAAYIKLQIVDETTVVISFKQLEDSRHA